MGSAPRERLGIVSGMLAINRTIGQTIGIAILGALWVNRVIFYSSSKIDTSATEADSISQVLALNDTFSVVAFLILFAIGLSLWGLLIDRKNRSSENNNPEI